MTVLVVGDQSQLEPRLMAHFSEDPRLMDVYLDGHGDIYADMAEGIFGSGWTKDHRGICKTLVLAMGYGAGDKKVGSILTVNGYPTDVDTGAAYTRELRGTYPVFFQWREQVIKRVHRSGYVQTIGGRHRRLKAAFVDRRNWKNVGYGERQAVNAIIQGSAGDIMRRIMVVIAREMPELLMLAQVHDELVFEALAVEVVNLARLADLGANGHGFELAVPLVFEPHIGVSWYEGKEGAPLELPEGWDNETQDFEEER